MPVKEHPALQKRGRKITISTSSKAILAATMLGFASIADAASVTPEGPGKELAQGSSSSPIEAMLSYTMSLVGPPLPPLVLINGILLALWKLFRFRPPGLCDEPRYIEVAASVLSGGYWILKALAPGDDFATNMALSLWASFWSNYAAQTYRLVANKMLYVWSVLLGSVAAMLSLAIVLALLASSLGASNTSLHEIFLVDAIPAVVTGISLAASRISPRSHHPYHHVIADDGPPIPSGPAYATSRPAWRHAYRRGIRSTSPAKDSRFMYDLEQGNPWENELGTSGREAKGEWLMFRWLRRMVSV